MNLTLGFITFFISIIIPGILFRRFFFYGEFSKQFNTKDPVLHSIFFSIIPGIVIQSICFITYYAALGFDTSFFDVFTIFKDFTSESTQKTNLVTKNFINNDIIIFFIYIVNVFGISSLLGFLSSRFIRARKWDMKYKLFRFKNQWYYIFSGEVLNMRKFEEAHKASLNNNKTFEQDTFMTYADILLSVSEANDSKELYTGYVVDYDLMSDDITQLDKIYLIDTHRYKKKEKKYDKNGVEIVEASDENSSKSRNRIKVPGDIFILNAKNIVNINLTYIPSTKKKNEKEQKKIEKQQKLYKRIQNTYFIIISFVIIIHFFYKILFLNESLLSDYFIRTGFFGKLISVLLINQIISVFVPLDVKDEKIDYDFSDIWKRIFVIIVWSVLFCFVVLRNLI